MGHTLLIGDSNSFPVGAPVPTRLIGSPLKSPNYAGRKPEAVLAVACAGGKARGQRVNGIEVRAHKIDLRRANGKVVR